MIDRFTRLIEDLKIFLADLRSLSDPKTASAGLVHFWGDMFRDQERRTPLIFTVAVHIGALVFAIFGPMIMTIKPTIPEIYTVDLYNVIEQQPKIQKPVVQKKVVTKPPPKAAPVKASPAKPPPVKTKAVSLNPLKKRLAKEKVKRDEEKRRLDLLKSRMEEVKLEFKKDQAEKEAKKAASTAVSRISDLYRKEKKHSDTKAIPAPVVQPLRTKPPPVRQRNARELEALDRYKALLVQHIDKSWKLPELKNWSDKLECVMIIKVNRNGWVLSNYFKKRSSDHRFNQYVKKAVESSIPFPPFPTDMPQQTDEIHVTFYPGGLL